MDRSIAGLFAGHLALQALDVLLGLDDTGLSACYLGLQLRDFEHSQRLTSANPVADIDVDMPYVTGDLAMDVDLLKRLKDSGYCQLIRNEPCVRRGGRDDRRGRGSFCIPITVVVSMQKIDKRQNCNDAARLQ